MGEPFRQVLVGQLGAEFAELAGVGIGLSVKPLIDGAEHAWDALPFEADGVVLPFAARPVQAAIASSSFLRPSRNFARAASSSPARRASRDWRSAS